MGNVSGYVKIQDSDDSTRHLIRLNQLHDVFKDDRNVYDFQKHEIGCVDNGKYEKKSTVYISGVEECYKYNRKGMVELYQKKWFLEYLKNAAVEHINNTFKIKDEEELINLLCVRILLFILRYI